MRVNTGRRRPGRDWRGADPVFTRLPDTGVIEIARYNYRHEAEIAAGFLQDAGIPAWVQVDDAGGYDFGLGFARMARLLVARADLERAREVLDGTGFEGLQR